MRGASSVQVTKESELARVLISKTGLALDPWGGDSTGRSSVHWAFLLV
jgi:hypothetical protein